MSHVPHARQKLVEKSFNFIIGDSLFHFSKKNTGAHQQQEEGITESCPHPSQSTPILYRIPWRWRLWQNLFFRLPSELYSATSDLLKFADLDEVKAELEGWKRQLQMFNEVVDKDEPKQMTKLSIKQWVDDLRDLA